MTAQAPSAVTTSQYHLASRNIAAPPRSCGPVRGSARRARERRISHPGFRCLSSPLSLTCWEERRGTILNRGNGNGQRQGQEQGSSWHEEGLQEGCEPLGPARALSRRRGAPAP